MALFTRFMKGNHCKQRDIRRVTALSNQIFWPCAGHEKHFKYYINGKQKPIIRDFAALVTLIYMKFSISNCIRQFDISVSLE